MQKRRMKWCVGLLALVLAARAQAALTLIHSGTTLTNVAAAVDTTARHTFVKVWNNCSQTAYLGWTSSVTAANGIPVPPSAWVEFSVDVTAGNRLFGIVASGTCDVRTLETQQ